MYSVSALVDAGGRVVETYRYDAFGGLTFTPKVEPVSGKYLRITLPPGESGSSSERKVRIRVRPDCAGSTWKYVRPPAVNPRNGAGWAALVADNCQGSACDPGETTAGMAGYGGWGPVVYVTGAEIVPGKRYVVEVEHRLDGVTVATQTARTSWPTGRWGDTDGNGTVNFLDVSRIVAAFQGSALTSSDNSAFYAADLVGGTCAANNLINFQDTGAAVKAFQRQGEPYSEVTSCAEPACTGCTESSCAGPIVIPHNPYRFQGQRLDFDLRLGKALPWAPNSPETGQPDLTLYHFRARAYEARHGRFLQRDPLEFHDGMNPYEAFKGNPLKYLDPTGKKNWAAYMADRQRYGALSADFYDWLGYYEVTPSGDDYEDVIRQLKNRRQVIKELGVGLESGLEIIGAFNDGADLAIVVNEVGQGKLSLAQLAVLLPFIGERQLVVLNKCGKKLFRMSGDTAQFLGSIKPARELKALTRGIRKSNGVELHHLIESRFTRRLGIGHADDVEAVLVDAMTHRGVGPESITNALRAEIPYRPNGNYDDVPIQAIYEAHRKVYGLLGIPELMQAIDHWFVDAGAQIAR